MSHKPEANDIKALLDLEQRRCAAMDSIDADALKQILAEEYLHIHAAGNIDDRDGLIDCITTNPRVTERGDIMVRLYGDVALLIGEQINKRSGNSMVGTMQQVAVRKSGDWRFVSAQMTRKQ